MAWLAAWDALTHTVLTVLEYDFDSNENKTRNTIRNLLVDGLIQHMATGVMMVNGGCGCV